MRHPTCVSWLPRPTPCWCHGSHLGPGLLATSSSTRSLDPLPEKCSLGPALASRRPLLPVLLFSQWFFFSFLLIPLNTQSPSSSAASATLSHEKREALYFTRDCYCQGSGAQCISKAMSSWKCKFSTVTIVSLELFCCFVSCWKLACQFSVGK